MEKQKIIVNGTNKFLLTCGKNERYILKFADDATQFDDEGRSGFPGKGKYRINISEIIFKYLHSYNIPTHYIARSSDTEMEVRHLEMLPVIVRVRNYAAGSFAKKFKLKKGELLRYPVLEYYLKIKGLGEPMITESHAYAMEHASPEEMKHVARLSLKINAVLKSFMERRNLKLADYQLEFGRDGKKIVLGDEISPDTCRVWAAEEGRIDFSYFSFSNGHAKSAYETFYNRLLIQKGS